MVTKTEEILARKARYDRVERAADTDGRLIGVRRLKPSQQLRVQEMAPGLEGVTTVVDEKTARSYDVPKITPLVLAASVVEIDGVPVPFPRSRGELDAILDSLDESGLIAATEALSRFSPADTSNAGVDAAKNSAETPA